MAADGGFAAFAPRHLRIKNTQGRIVPFRLNDAQVALHELVRKQEHERQYVRMVVLKARQLGISTYIAARSYYKIHRRTGMTGMIVAHEKKASANLNSMVRTFHDFNDPLMRPRAARSNKEEINFPGLRSGMQIATARNLESGRSFTNQIFHGSEVAYWPDAGSIMKGAMQGIHAVPGTDIWFESTARGPVGSFYSACQAARKGEFSDYGFVFLPWTIEPSYVRDVPDGFEDNGMNPNDREYMGVHGMSLEQMSWRAGKIAEIKNLSSVDDEEARVIFGQEFPACPEDAFNAADQQAFIGVFPVIRARQAFREKRVTYADQKAAGYPLILGVDPSWIGNDRFTVWARCGRIAWRVKQWKKRDTVTSSQRVIDIMAEMQPDYVCIDASGVGAGVYDTVAHMVETIPGIYGMVYCVLAGQTAEEEERHALVRDECWARMKDWLTNPPFVALQDDDAIQADLTNIRNKGDTKRRVRLESKDELRKESRGSLPSPDDADALANTFFLRDTGTHIGRAGIRSGGRPNPNRRFSYKTGGSR